MYYLPENETIFENGPTFEKIQTAEENIFKKIISNEEHVLCQFLPPNIKSKYSLRPRPHCYYM